MVLQNTHPMIGTCGTLSWQLVEVCSTLFLKFLKIVIFCYFYLLMCMYDTPPETFAFIFLLLLSSPASSEYSSYDDYDFYYEDSDDDDDDDADDG